MSRNGSMVRDEVLFKEGWLREFLENRESKMLAEIDGLAERLLEASVDATCDYFVRKFGSESPEIREDQITIDQSETQVDARLIRDIFASSDGPHFVPATQITFRIPFVGTADLFRYRPSRYTSNSPRGTISGQELLITVVGTDHNLATFQVEFQSRLGEIRQWLGFVAEEMRGRLDGLRATARGRIEGRRRKLLADRNLAASLGFPLRANPTPPPSPSVPLKRKKIGFTDARKVSQGFVPEPAIEHQAYEDILSMLRGMSVTMERCPAAFRGLEEEHLRMFFLATLNAQFDGAATGETFNSEGKTDILIRIEGRNLFIGECKFWKGPSGFAETIDQVLGYAQWRDCKLAILVFNKNKDFTSVLTKIRETTKAHPSFRREVSTGDQTSFRCAVRHRDDPDREMTLTVLAFEIPG